MQVLFKIRAGEGGRPGPFKAGLLYNYNVSAQYSWVSCTHFLNMRVQYHKHVVRFFLCMRFQYHKHVVLSALLQAQHHYNACCSFCAFVFSIISMLFFLCMRVQHQNYAVLSAVQHHNYVVLSAHACSASYLCCYFCACVFSIITMLFFLRLHVQHHNRVVLSEHVCSES